MKTKFLLFFIVFLDMLGIGIIIPIFPNLLANPASSGYMLGAAVSIKTAYIILGLCSGVYPLMQFFSTPILGAISDSVGRRPVLLLCLLGSAVGYVLTGFSIVWHIVPLLFIGRALDGITGGNISIVQAIVADTTTRENRAASFGMIGAAFGLGFIFGPVLGGVLSDAARWHLASPQLPLWVAAGLSLLGMTLVYYFLPETHTADRRVSRPWSLMTAFHGVARVWSKQHIRGLTIVQFLYASAFTFFTTFSAVFFISRFGLSERGLGLYFGYIGIWIVIAQGFIVRRLIKKFSERTLLPIGIAITAVALLAHFIPHTWVGLLFIAPFFAIANGIANASLPALVSRTLRADEQGEGLGLFAGIQGLAASWPPIISGFIAALVSPYVPMLVASGLMIIACIFYWWAVQRHQEV